MKEVSLTLGRLLMCGILIGITAYFSLAASFVAAAIISLGVTSIAKFHAKEL